jgi:hypothetical protein
MARKKIDPVDRRVELAYYRSCSGIQIDIMDISKVFKFGRDLILKEDPADAQLDVAIHQFVLGLADGAALKAG